MQLQYPSHMLLLFSIYSAYLQSIQGLDICYCLDTSAFLHSDSCLKHLKKTAHNLKKLDILGCPKITRFVLVYFSLDSMHPTRSNPTYSSTYFQWQLDSQGGIYCTYGLCTLFTYVRTSCSYIHMCSFLLYLSYTIIYVYKFVRCTFVISFHVSESNISRAFSHCYTVLPGWSSHRTGRV